MNFYFYDLTELEADIIIDVLDKHEVKYKIFYSNIGYGPFSEIQYHICIDVALEYFDYLKAKVEKRIGDMINLEKNFNLEDFKHPPLKQRKRRPGKKKNEQEKTECSIPDAVVYLSQNACFSEVLPDGVYTEREFFKRLNKWRKLNE